MDCNVILITVDALRADHLSTYGYFRNTSPNIDKLSEKSFVFDNAHTTVPQTKPSITSMLYGAYSYKTGIRANEHHAISIKNNSLILPLALKNKGYITSAFVGAQWLYEKQTNFNNYFDTYFPEGIRSSEITAEEMNNEIIPWLRINKREKFFLWIHYKDPHAKYIPPVNYSVFVSTEKDLISKDLIPAGYELEEAFTENGLTDANYYRAQYDNEILYVDFAIGDIISEIQKLGIENRTIVIITADHGESMGEHQSFFRHATYYEHDGKIPLIIFVPQTHGKIISSLSSNMDIYPTIIELISNTSENVPDGRSLIPAVRNGSEIRQFLFSELYNPFANQSLGASIIDSDGNKLIVHLNGDVECYNLQITPSEEGQSSCTKESYERLLIYLINSSDDVKKENGDEVAKHGSDELLKSLDYIE